MRDHLQYNDELMCAAARVVSALREKASEYEPLENIEGRFNTSEFIHSNVHNVASYDLFYHTATNVNKLTANHVLYKIHL